MLFLILCPTFPLLLNTCQNGWWYLPVVHQWESLWRRFVVWWEGVKKYRKQEFLCVLLASVWQQGRESSRRGGTPAVSSLNGTRVVVGCHNLTGLPMTETSQVKMSTPVLQPLRVPRCLNLCSPVSRGVLCLPWQSPFVSPLLFLLASEAPSHALPTHNETAGPKWELQSSALPCG